MVSFHTGNIIDSGADIICHQVNCRGAMNSGVAKAIRQRWPEVYTEYHQCAKDIDIGFGDMQLSWEHMLGHIQVVYLGEENGHSKGVINMFEQEGYGYDGRRYTSYDAFWSCLGEIKKYINPEKTIAFPARIGCVRGGANWNVILTMISEVLGEDYNVEIWDYDKG
jgi:O-acetyl-ADP-ribose deacetylase (regulator of RNase III)